MILQPASAQFAPQLPARYPRLVAEGVCPLQGDMSMDHSAHPGERTHPCHLPLPCRGTDFDDPGDVVVDADCQYTANMGKYVGSKYDVRLHTGFYRAWESVAPYVLDAVRSQLKQVSESTAVAAWPGGSQ